MLVRFVGPADGLVRESDVVVRARISGLQIRRDFVSRDRIRVVLLLHQQLSHVVPCREERVVCVDGLAVLRERFDGFAFLMKLGCFSEEFECFDTRALVVRFDRIDRGFRFVPVHLGRRASDEGRYPKDCEPRCGAGDQRLEGGRSVVAGWHDGNSYSIRSYRVSVTLVCQLFALRLMVISRTSSPGICVCDCWIH